MEMCIKENLSNEEYVARQYKKCVAIIENSLEKKDFEKALAAISICANLLYQWNQKYSDEFLEQSVRIIAKETKTLEIDNLQDLDKDTILFYDNFGLDTRGLALIYIKALANSGKKVIYLTSDLTKDRQPEIDKIISTNRNVQKFFFTGKTYLNKIKELQNVIITFKPWKAFFYTTPYDSDGTVVFNQIAGKIIRYQINLTDHAFWLGVNAFDYCIEFRSYGASISSKYRGIDEKNILILPYYPFVDKKIEFQGFPFDAVGKKIVFSGGSLYKTIDKNRTYYKIVSKILEANDNVIFLYAGNGDDTFLIDLQNKFKSRVFHIEERKDLYQLMQHVTIYLNTYPMIGGLMTQYAAMANKVPLTLKRDLDASGILIDQDRCCYEYDSSEALVKDAIHLLADADYLRQREKLLDASVISEDVFNRQVLNLLETDKTDFKIAFFDDMDTENFRSDYKIRFDRRKFERAVCTRKNISLITEYPCGYIQKIVGGGYSNALQEGSYNVSVVVAVYKPDVEKLLTTIMSILVQKGISKQIVICDDESDNFPLDKIINFFESQNFTDYIICLSKENKGIVQNVLNGIGECYGEYVKMISPGDYLHKENTLSEWYKLIKHKDADLSISNAIYYKKNADGSLETIRHKNHPQINKRYYQNKWYYNYLIFDDISLGACVLSKTDATRKYLLLIKDRVKFAEDNIYRIMAADKLSMVYFENDSLLYEYGTGISTSGNDMWAKRIKDDWNATNEIILERFDKLGNFEKSFEKVIKSRDKKGIEAKLYKFLSIRGFFWNWLKLKLKTKYTNLQIDMQYFEKIKKLP